MLQMFRELESIATINGDQLWIEIFSNIKRK